MCWAIIIAAGPNLGFLADIAPISKPDVRAAENTDPIKRVDNPNNGQDYSQYLKRNSTHKRQFCSNEVNQSEDQSND